MQIEVCATPQMACARAADLIASIIERAIAEHGLASIALSGGSTPAEMLSRLAVVDLDWSRVHLFQVDERLVPETDDRSNMKQIRSAFAATDLPFDHLHAMPVSAVPPEAGAAAYAEVLRALTGTPPVVDVVHLGLGADGHTASLFPGDEVLGASGDVAVAGVHGDIRRMTLTLPVLNSARVRIWLVTGASKCDVVERFVRNETELIASRVRSDDSYLILDRAASAELSG